MRKYSQDLRERVLADCDAGMGTMEVAPKYRVSQSWVRRLKQRRRTTGSIYPKSQRDGRQARWLEHAKSLAEIVRETPDITLEELRAGATCRAGASQPVWRDFEIAGPVVEKESPEVR